VKHEWPENGLVKRSVGADTQRLQKTLFREKNTLIENCLFGVDINPNSVNICRLRLWIELLKNAYYREETDFQALEVLPNIDINIKQGNSLISRFDLDTSLSRILANNDEITIDDYKEAVKNYKETGNRNNKQKLKKQIESIKNSFTVGLELLHPERIKLKDLKAELLKLETQKELFGDEIEEGGSRVVRIIQAKNDIEKQQTVVNDLENATFYNRAFEWRFEFPEVLNEDGDFIGFDVVIGNPPYGIGFSKTLNQHLKAKFETNTWRGESYVAFTEMSLGLLKEFGQLAYIIPDTLLNLGFTSALRRYLLKKTRLKEVVLLPRSVFDSATVDTIILRTEKRIKYKVQSGEKVSVRFYPKDQSIETVYHPDKKFKVPLTYWQKIGGFNVYSTKKEIEIILKLDSNNRFDQVASAYSGIKCYEVDKGTPPQTKEIRKNKPYTSENKRDKNWAPFYDGKHIGRYENYWKNNNWIKYGEWLAAPRSPEIFEGEKILARKIVSDRLIATYIPKKSYCNTLLFAIKIQDERYSYKFLLGILNSQITGWYYRKRFQINPEDTFPQILIRDINQLPIPNVNQRICSKLELNVDQILTAKEANSNADTSKLERKIDQLVYKLYGLSEEDIAIVEESIKY
jgi:tRNA1(Val) A37 N6-methylase TrmN6